MALVQQYDAFRAEYVLTLRVYRRAQLLQDGVSYVCEQAFTVERMLYSSMRMSHDRKFQTCGAKSSERQGCSVRDNAVIQTTVQARLQVQYWYGRPGKGWHANDLHSCGETECCSS